MEYPSATGPLAKASEAEKRKRLDAMVQFWQNDTERRLTREGREAFLVGMGLNEYRYSVWLRFPEWERSVVLGQVTTVRQEAGEEKPVLFTQWRQEALLKTMPDWKKRLPQENVFNICVRLTPGGLGEGSKWAIMMPREMVSRYRPGWPTQQEWVAWTREFDWVAVAVGFIRAMLDALA